MLYEPSLSRFRRIDSGPPLDEPPSVVFRARLAERDAAVRQR